MLESGRGEDEMQCGRYKKGGTSQIQHIVDAPDISTVGVSLTLGGCGASAARAAAVAALALLPPKLLL